MRRAPPCAIAFDRGLPRCARRSTGRRLREVILRLPSQYRVLLSPVRRFDKMKCLAPQVGLEPTTLRLTADVLEHLRLLAEEKFPRPIATADDEEPILVLCISGELHDPTASSSCSGRGGDLVIAIRPSAVQTASSVAARRILMRFIKCPRCLQCLRNFSHARTCALSKRSAVNAL